MSAAPRPIVRIDALAAGGDGVGRLPDGRVVFVPRSAPGDRVEIELTRDLPRRAHGEIQRLLEPGPGRREPPCELADRCGGCDWQHLDEATQSAARQAAVRDALRRLGGLEELPAFEALPSPRALGYRARARVAYESGRVGFRARSSRDVVDVARCPVLDAPTQAALDRLRRHPPAGAGERDLRGIDAELQAAGRAWRVRAGGFYQANAALWDAWLERVAELCGRGRRAVELYAGMGFYTAELCERYERVTAIESSASARELAANAPRAEVVRAPAERWARTRLARQQPELVLLNPPRTGCHKDVSDTLRDARPRAIVYVSCDPATLARDLARMGVERRVTRVVVIDAFPQTHHVEVIVRTELDRPAKSA